MFEGKAANAVAALGRVQEGADAWLEAWFAPIAQAVSNAVFASVEIADAPFPLIVGWLVTAGLFCTLYFRFINLRGFAHGFRLIRGDYADPNAAGQVSHFQALATALSGTVGLGNIAGVALAISVGGPGATFWMILAGLLGMSSKFCECTLGVMFRRENPDGSVSGGPMYYLSRGIAREYPRLAPFGRALGFVFAVCCIGGAIGAGNLFQSNGALQALVVITGGEGSSPLDGRGWIFGLVLAVLVGLVIVGGIRSIARVTDKLVPLMAAIYMLGGFIVLGAFAERIPDALAAIVTGAFSPQGVEGGIIGVIVMGFRRAAFSNEAGVGPAAIAHSAVRTKEPVTEGFVALWEPFIDTVVICTMSALVIIVSDAVALAPGQTGVALTATAFGTVAGWFKYVLALAVFLFAYSTMISYAYYGEKASTYLFGEHRAVSIGYKLLFLSATVIGCTSDFRAIADFSDAVFFLMAIPNVIGLYLLAPAVRRELESYLRRLRAGEIRSYRTPPSSPIASP